MRYLTRLVEGDDLPSCLPTQPCTNRYNEKAEDNWSETRLPSWPALPKLSGSCAVGKSGVSFRAESRLGWQYFGSLKFSTKK